MNEVDAIVLRGVNLQINRGNTSIRVPGGLLGGMSDDGRHALKSLIGVNGCELIVDG